jgi:hypothetical protein
MRDFVVDAIDATGANRDLDQMAEAASGYDARRLGGKPGPTFPWRVRTASPGANWR